MEAKISEIFYSFQGEGVYQLIPQMFIRFWGCNFNCSFCDTRISFFKLMSLEEVLDEVFSLDRYWHSISLTGGEPLLQIDFLNQLCKELKARDQIIYLETNGILYENLRKVIDYIDIVAMDFKLPSSTGAGEVWLEHKEFLKIAKEKEVFVKAVINLFTEEEDLIKALEILREVSPQVIFVLQPVFSYEVALHSKLEKFRKIASDFSIQTKIIPQLHKHLNIR